MDVEDGTPQATAEGAGRSSLRRLRLVTILTPCSLVLVLAGPSVAAIEGLPLPTAVGQPLFAGLGACAALVAVYHADACDDLPTIADQNLRLLMLLLSLVAVAIAGAWLWLGAMNLVDWLLGSAVTSPI